MLLAAFNLIWAYGSKARCHFHIDNRFCIKGTPFAKSFATNNETWRMLSIPFVLKKMRHGTAEFQWKLWHVRFELWLKSEKFPEFEDLEISMLPLFCTQKDSNQKPQVWWCFDLCLTMDQWTYQLVKLGWQFCLKKKHPKNPRLKTNGWHRNATPKNDKGSHFPWSSIFGFFYLVSFGRYLSKLGTTRILQKKAVDVGGKQLEDSEPILLVLSNNLW